MSQYKTDIIVAVIFIAGVWGFVSGEFIVSSALFCSAALIGALPRKPLYE